MLRRLVASLIIVIVEWRGSNESSNELNMNQRRLRVSKDVRSG